MPNEEQNYRQNDSLMLDLLRDTNKEVKGLNEKLDKHLSEVCTPTMKDFEGRISTLETTQSERKGFNKWILGGLILLSSGSGGLAGASIEKIKEILKLLKF